MRDCQIVHINMLLDFLHLPSEIFFFQIFNLINWNIKLTKIYQISWYFIFST